MACSPWQRTGQRGRRRCNHRHWPCAQFEEVSFDESGITQNDWNSYPIPTMYDIPEIEVVLLNNPKVGTRRGVRRRRMRTLHPPSQPRSTMQALESCSVRDPAHIQLGATGDHVGEIQMALELVTTLNIEKAELASNKYGESTTRAVLDYKKKRRIINFSYQSKADNIVGKMTICST